MSEEFTLPPVSSSVEGISESKRNDDVSLPSIKLDTKSDAAAGAKGHENDSTGTEEGGSAKIDSSFVGGIAGLVLLPEMNKLRTMEEKDLRSLGSLTRDSDSDETDEDDDPIEQMRKKVPVIPPKNQTKPFELPEDIKDRAVWFRVLSPRERRGTDGPYSEEDLKHMFRKGDLPDSTLLWKEGQDDWEQLMYLTELRPKLLSMPFVPPSLGEKTDHETFNPILALPTKAEASGAAALDSIPLNKCCTRCGHVAIGHMPGVGENKPDMVGLRSSISYPNKDMASEVVPGIIWCGNASASKLNPILDMGMTLIINCTSNMGNPNPKLPYFRCKTIPLVDKPKTELTPKDMEKALELLEKAYDWIELERTQPERALLSDPVPTEMRYLEKTDKFGRVIKTREEVAIKLRLGKVKRVPRVLLWSRKGMDRPCVVAAAYMIKQYGMSYDKALDILEIARPGTLICKYYKNVLKEFSRRHTLGELLCIDCVNISREASSHLTHNEPLMDASNWNSNTELITAAVSENRSNNKDDNDSVVTSMTNGTLGPPLTKEEKSINPHLAEYVDLVPRRGDATKITNLGDINLYLPKIYHGASLQSGWTGLVDLQLVGRGLGDETIGDLFDAFATAQLCQYFRCVDLRSNLFGDKGMKSIMSGFLNIHNHSRPATRELGGMALPGLGLAGALGLPDLTVSESMPTIKTADVDDGTKSLLANKSTVSMAELVIKEKGEITLGKSPKKSKKGESPDRPMSQERRRGGANLLLQAAASVAPSDTTTEGVDGKTAIDNDVVDEEMDGKGHEDDGGKAEAEEICFMPELIKLDVSCNNIGLEGSKYIAKIMRYTANLIHVNVAYNPLTDQGARNVIDVLTMPNPEFVEDTPKTAEEEEKRKFNYSITYLDMSDTGIGHTCCEGLLETFRSNMTLSTFKMDFNHDINARECKHLFNSMRSFNKSLQNFSFADNPISAKSTGYLSRLLELKSFPLMTLNLSKCDLTETHIAFLCQYLPKSIYLSSLSINTNPITDEGAQLLIDAITVPHSVYQEAIDEVLKERARLEAIANRDMSDTGHFVDHYAVQTYADLEEKEEEKAVIDMDNQKTYKLANKETIPGAPLKYLDISMCRMSEWASKGILKACCSRPSIQTLHLSGNSIGDNIEEIENDLVKARFIDLHLNQCGLLSKSAVTLFRILKHTDRVEDPLYGPTNVLGSHLRALYLANNDIHDSAVFDLRDMMLANNELEVLDLGFNQFTNEAASTFKEAIAIQSDTNMARKVTTLTANIVGNPCDAFLLDTPGMSRSKLSFRFNTHHPGYGDKYNDGFSHISQPARKHYFERQAALSRKMDLTHQLEWPIKSIA
jgi:Ran GTPase-activating protein (RanGAP) involved in mRNA processing and transport